MRKTLGRPAKGVIVKSDETAIGSEMDYKDYKSLHLQISALLLMYGSDYLIIVLSKNIWTLFFPLSLRMKFYANGIIFLRLTEGDIYVGFHQKKTWFEARNICFQDCGDLVQAREINQQQHEKILSALTAVGITPGDTFHVGLTLRPWVWQGKKLLIFSGWT